MDFDLTEEQIMIQRAAKEFTEREIEPIAAEVDRDGEIPPDMIKKLGKANLLGMICPKKYGGSEVGNLSCILACEQLGYAGSAIFWIAAMNNSTGETISHFGTEEMGKKYVRPICKGQVYASTAFTEAATGSDPRAISTTALPEGDYYIINGAKRFITNGAEPGPAVIYANDDGGRLSAFVVEKNSEGYTTSKPWELMGVRGQGSVDIYLDDVRVPKVNLIGNKGEGFDILLRWIACEKVQQSAGSVGLAQAALDEAVKYAKERIVRERPLASMQAIQWMLAEMTSRVEAARWLTYRAAFLQDKGLNIQTDAAVVKLFAVPAATEVAGMSLRVHGAYGYTKEFKIERLYRAAKAAEVVATSIELQRTIIASALIA
jgi:alkylation response protein AidB-like acyl-CoA dehydrogenase